MHKVRISNISLFQKIPTLADGFPFIPNPVWVADRLADIADRLTDRLADVADRLTDRLADRLADIADM